MQLKHTAKANAGSPEPLDITRQQRLVELEQLADIFLSIFCELSSAERANMMSDNAELKAA
ncbi:MAG: hypothetical protein DMG65_08495 [Candidatus Angelobacter sp. Gp1-AA117]|nr:MAG: hypothetical protein DMG65_08495 [Candidatus Angelobacter sp. Gp1-AA117]